MLFCLHSLTSKSSIILIFSVFEMPILNCIVIFASIFPSDIITKLSCSTVRSVSTLLFASIRSDCASKLNGKFILLASIPLLTSYKNSILNSPLYNIFPFITFVSFIIGFVFAQYILFEPTSGIEICSLILQSCLIFCFPAIVVIFFLLNSTSCDMLYISSIRLISLLSYAKQLNSISAST